MTEVAGSSPDLAANFSVDLQNPISFTSDPTAAQRPYIKKYIDSNPQVFKARPDLSILQSPPQLVLQLQTGVERILAADKIILDLNNHILVGSPSLHWAAEVYQHIPQNTRAWLTSKLTPGNLNEIETDRLSPHFGVYFCKVGDELYCGSGTSLGSEKSAASGTLIRQNTRSTSRKSTNELCKMIKAAEKKNLPVQWAQGMEILGTKELDNHDLGNLLHFRVLSKLGEQLLSMGTCAHKNYLYQWNSSFWDTTPTWKPACSRPAWPEPIRGVSTPEIRNARSHVENLTPEQQETRNARKRIENLTPEGHLKELTRRHVENLTPDQLESKRAREKVENMTPEQQEARNARRRIENLTFEEHEKEKGRRLVGNLAPDQLLRKRKREKVENLTPVQLEKKRANDRIQYAKKKAKREAAKALKELSASEINTSTA